MKLATLGLPLVLLATAGLPACGDSDGDGDGPGGVDDIVVIGRAPCGARGHWNDGVVQTTRYTNDPRGHAVRTVVTAPDGTVLRTIERGWQGDQLQSVDFVSETYDYLLELTHDDAGRRLVSTRTDRDLTDGDDGYTLTNQYDGGALIAYLVDNADPERDDTRSTVTGHRTRREVTVDCSVADPTSCDTWVFEQADGDPRHWTAGTWDLGSDGVLDYRFARTLDRHGLELTYVETDLSGGGEGVVTMRTTTVRDDDGTEVSGTDEWFNADGTPWDTFVRENDFVCDQARIAAPGPARPSPAAGARVRPARLTDARRLNGRSISTILGE